MGLSSYDIKKLTKQFYIDYPQSFYPEILRKDNRPYDVATFNLYENLFICVPFRSNMMHHNGYHFHNSMRSRQHHSGLDYSKIIIFEDRHYFDGQGIVDKDELREFKHNYVLVHKQLIKYICTYIDHVTGNKLLNEKMYERLYKYSTLPYFHKELQILELYSSRFINYMMQENRLYVNY